MLHACRQATSACSKDDVSRCVGVPAVPGSRSEVWEGDRHVALWPCSRDGAERARGAATYMPFLGSGIHQLVSLRDDGHLAGLQGRQLHPDVTHTCCIRIPAACRLAAASLPGSSLSGESAPSSALCRGTCSPCRRTCSCSLAI